MDLLEGLGERVIYVGTRTISREGENRYKIYLPMNMNRLWRELHDRRCKVEVYLVVKGE